MPKHFTCLVSLLFLLGVVGVPRIVRAQGGCRYESWARGEHVVPPTQFPGFAYLESDFDGRGDCSQVIQLFFEIRYDSLASPPTGARIRRGTSGLNGDIVLTLFDTYFPSGARATILLDSATCEEIFSGKLYFVVETADYPDGAVRGQVFAECWGATESASWGRIRSLYR